MQPGYPGWWENMRLLIYLLPAVAAAIALCFIAPAAVLNAIARGGDVTVERDVIFGADPRLKLDIYRLSRVDEGAPVVVFFYGGSWQRGEKAVYRFVGASLARAGIVAVIPDYRIYPPVVYPDFLRDSALAVRWTKENITRFGGDPAKLFLAGHSAGAYNAAMLTLDSRWLSEVKLDPKRDLRGAIGIAGPYDFLPLESAELKIIFGPEDARPATQPIAYADGKAPPMLLLRPAADDVVDPGNSERLAARIGSNGGEAMVKTYAGVGHLSIVGTFSPLLSFLAPVRDDLIRFVFHESVRAAR
jgi:acetyl esterase/lipase